MKKYLKLSYLVSVLLLLSALPAWAASPTAGRVRMDKKENAAYYTIIRHDTLWDISKRFLNDPFKWPYLWKLNPYIKNPDLIYPGDVVKVVPLPEEQVRPKGIDINSLPVVRLSESGSKVVVLEPEKPVAKEQKSEGPSYGGADLRKNGFISMKDFRSSGIIMKPKGDRLLLSAGDEVFLSFYDNSSVHEGDRYTIFTMGSLVRHPVTGKKMGHMVDILGTLKVTKSSGVIEGKIDTAVAEIEAGAKLMVYKEMPREVRMTFSTSSIDGYVVASLTGNKNLSKGDILYIDKGTKDGLTQGRLLKVLRYRGAAHDPITGKKVKLPPSHIGDVVVVEAEGSTSSCIVIKSRKTIMAGDHVSASEGL